jgi:hypothetical protein
MREYDKIDKNEPEVDWRRRIEDVEDQQIEAICYRWWRRRENSRSIVVGGERR